MTERQQDQAWVERDRAEKLAAADCQSLYMIGVDWSKLKATPFGYGFFRGKYER